MTKGQRARGAPLKLAPLVGAENVENRLVSLSMAAAEQRILDGTVTDAVLVHFLKLGSVRAELEIRRMNQEVELMNARTDMIHQQSNTDDGYQSVINAILGYRGRTFDEDVS